MSNRRKINNLDGENTKYVVVFLDSDIVSEGFKNKSQAQRRYDLEKETDEDQSLELLTIDEFEEKYQSEE